MLNISSMRTKKKNLMMKIKICKFLCRFDCVAEGNPAPSVFWTKEVSFSLTPDTGSPMVKYGANNNYPSQGNQDLVFAGTSHGTLHVSPQGSLSIQVLQAPLFQLSSHLFKPTQNCHQLISRAFVWRTRGSLCVRPFLWRGLSPRRLTWRSPPLAMSPLQSSG